MVDVRRISKKILGATGFNISFPSKALSHPCRSCFIPLVNKKFFFLSLTKDMTGKVILSDFTLYTTTWFSECFRHFDDEPYGNLVMYFFSYFL